MATFDLVVVGAGIVGLAHALAAARRGLRVAVLERDARAVQASVRNFGLVTVSGQGAGDSRRRALRSREVWLEVAPEAGIAIVQRGAIVVARREEAYAVLREFVADAMGAGCEMLDASQARERVPALRPGIVGALASPHELRVEAREALPRLAKWLERRHGVSFHWGCAALAVDGASVRHAQGKIDAGAVVIAPGTAVAEFAPALARRVGLRYCKLQMMRVDAGAAHLPAVVMSDLSLARYPGFTALPAAARLRTRLDRECRPQLENGVHLIVARDADGSLLIGDSHHYDEHADPFARPDVDEMILTELRELFDLPQARVTERWIGYYPVAAVKPVLSEALSPRVRLVTVTSGTGMSTAFAIGEETVEALP